MDILIGSVNRFTNSPQFSKWIATQPTSIVQLFRSARYIGIRWDSFRKISNRA